MGVGAHPRREVGPDARILVVSDLHLPQTPTPRSWARVRELLQMLERESPAVTHVVLLGDVFDFWFEYPHLVPAGFHGLLCHLWDLVRHGKEVSFFPGNHDFWLGTFLSRELGIRVAAERELWALGDRTVLFSHGDGLDPKDVGYLVLKAFLRHPWAVAAFRCLHPEVAFWLARKVSAASRRASQGKRTWGNDRYVPFARRAVASGVQVVVVAHSHTAQVVDLSPGLLVNPGDWLRARTFALLCSGNAQVFSWPDRTPLPTQSLDEIHRPPLGGGKPPPWAEDPQGSWGPGW